MNQQPAMQNLVNSALLIELAFFFADVFQIVDIRMQGCRQQHAQLTKKCASNLRICDPGTSRSCLAQVRTDFSGKHAAQFSARLLVHLHA